MPVPWRWRCSSFPIVVRTTEDMLLLVPGSLREAASALGMPRSLVIQRVSYKAARAGMITGVLLAVARVSGETAPLLFTALNNQFWSTNLNAPFSSLPVVIFQFALSPYADWQRLAWVGALIITFAVLALSIAARWLSSSRTIAMNLMPSSTTKLKEKISVRKLNFYYGDNLALKNINMPLYERQVTAFIGPSGCGKSTLLRVLNRMYDLYPEPARRGRGAARRRPTFSRPSRTSICCARASAWSSRSRRRSR